MGGGTGQTETRTAGHHPSPSPTRHPNYLFSSQVVISGGRIERVVSLSRASAAVDLRRAAALATSRPPTAVLPFPAAVLAPGCVDAHVHANDPGRAGWEGLESATAAAAAGGVTTVVDMPLNSRPAATTAGLLAAKARVVRSRALRADVGLWGGLVPANARDPGELAAMVSAGALGFKAFLSPSGIPDFANVSINDIHAALPTLMALGAPLVVHAELVDAAQGNDAVVSDATASDASPTATSDLSTWAASRPPAMEVAAVAGLVGSLKSAVDEGHAPALGFVLHIAHVASAAALAPLAAARAAGLPVSAETCPHYLGALDPASAPPGRAALFKCAPPLRGRSEAASLAAALADGRLDMVASDHSPSDPGLKVGAGVAFEAAWGGIAGLQYLLPATWTQMKGTGATPANLATWLAAHPARLARLGPAKGALAAGAAADIVVWDPAAPADTSAAACRHRHASWSPYKNASLYGRVLATFSRGRLVYAHPWAAPSLPPGTLRAGSGSRGGGVLAPGACGRLLTWQEDGGGREGEGAVAGGARPGGGARSGAADRAVAAATAAAA